MADKLGVPVAIMHGREQCRDPDTPLPMERRRGNGRANPKAASTLAERMAG